ncbi:MAG: DNA repair exonuclease [bacterium]|nr:DNA repair exonuclease [bacterium]
MPTSTTRILFVGDMHLGTRVARLPAGVGDPDDLGPAGAWRRTVDAALAHRVNAVALAGDVVNRRNVLFEAAAALRPGLERLYAAGIQILAVAGNHDTRALPGLLRAGAPLKLLGAGGTWEEHVLGGDGSPRVRVVGWSFPRETWESSPLADPPPPARADLPTFGLLHGDLDAGASNYAPVSGAALGALGYDGWLLGHIHVPSPVTTDGRPAYLGSLVGLDPTETGRHGPVLVAVAADGSITRERLPVAALRWERWEIPVPADLAGADDLQEHLLAELEIRTVGLGLPPHSVLGVRAVLTGAVARPLAVAEAAVALDPSPVNFDGVTVFVDRIDTDLRLELDLANLARGEDPPGLLARRILILENAEPDPDEEALTGQLLERLRTADEEARRLAPAAPRTAPDEAELRRCGARAARRLLQRLMAAKGGTP